MASFCCCCWTPSPTPATASAYPLCELRWLINHSLRVSCFQSHCGKILVGEISDSLSSQKWKVSEQQDLACVRDWPVSTSVSVSVAAFFRPCLTVLRLSVSVSWLWLCPDCDGILTMTAACIRVPRSLSVFVLRSVPVTCVYVCILICVCSCDCNLFVDLCLFQLLCQRLDLCLWPWLVCGVCVSDCVLRLYVCIYDFDLCLHRRLCLRRDLRIDLWLWPVSASLSVSAS